MGSYLTPYTGFPRMSGTHRCAALHVGGGSSADDAAGTLKPEKAGLLGPTPDPAPHSTTSQGSSANNAALAVRKSLSSSKGVICCVRGSHDLVPEPEEQDDSQSTSRTPAIRVVHGFVLIGNVSTIVDPSTNPACKSNGGKLFLGWSACCFEGELNNTGSSPETTFRDYVLIVSLRRISAALPYAAAAFPAVTGTMFPDWYLRTSGFEVQEYCPL
ncbi:hypothetical protein HPB50_009523 [Hyalomma asiaticum]|uniref:Uncharacterized protein n=1 Tax=Hyalomma asiaticum TaxID=266040 RepID=A0ACB7TF52_HYAAI|nr:hypothetical protein HPB50_009523 [Hyalomma asiaticum]